MSSPKSVHIVSICDDRSVRQSRALLLRQYNYEVHSFSSSALGPSDIPVIRQTDLVIVCRSAAHSILQLQETFRRIKPEIKILDLSFRTGCETGVPGSSMLSDEGLVRLVDLFVGRQRPLFEIERFAS